MELHINKYGSYINIKHGLIQIRTKDDTRQVPIHKVKKIYLNRTCKISTELVFTALENNIQVVFQKKSGEISGRIWNNKFGSIATIRKNQLRFAASEESRKWIRKILAKKVDAQIALLLAIDRDEGNLSDKISSTINKLDKVKQELLNGNSRPGVKEDDYIRSLEGRGSRAYFRCISYTLPDAYKFKKRSRKPAKDMFNGMLNYAYGILYSRVETALIRSGIDPAIGIFHVDQYNRPAMVFDVIEVFRPWADYVPVRLCVQEVIYPEFFDIPSGYYLNDSGKRILIQSFADYFDEVVWYNGNNRSRTHHINMYCQNLASMFKDFSN